MINLEVQQYIREKESILNSRLELYTNLRKYQIIERFRTSI